MWSWMLHRVTGIAMLLFISMHLLASFFTQQTGSTLAQAINILYESWIFQILMTFIVLFHALNGLRIAILDVWPRLQVYQRQALWVQGIIFTPVYGLLAVLLLQRAFSGG
jgi:succinate dehydrogenase / fumarate reductase cytochrome b subunit